MNARNNLAALAALDHVTQVNQWLNHPSQLGKALTATGIGGLLDAHFAVVTGDLDGEINNVRTRWFGMLVGLVADNIVPIDRLQALVIDAATRRTPDGAVALVPDSMIDTAVEKLTAAARTSPERRHQLYDLGSRILDDQGRRGSSIRPLNLPHHPMNGEAAVPVS